MEKTINDYSNLKVYNLNTEITIEDKIKQFKEILNKLNEEEQTLINTKLNKLLVALKSITHLADEFNSYYWNDLDEDDRDYLEQYSTLYITYLPSTIKDAFLNNIEDDFNTMVGILLVKYYGTIKGKQYLSNVKFLLNDEDFSNTNYTLQDIETLKVIKQDVINVLNNDVSLNDMVKISEILNTNGLNYDFFLNVLNVETDKNILYNVNDLYKIFTDKMQYDNLSTLLSVITKLNKSSHLNPYLDYNNDLNKNDALFIYNTIYNDYYNVVYADLENDFMKALSKVYLIEEDKKEETAE